MMARVTRRRVLALAGGSWAALAAACAPRQSGGVADGGVATGEVATGAAPSAAQPVPATSAAATAPSGGRLASTITVALLQLPPTLFHGLGGWSNLSKTEALVGDWLVMPDDAGRLVPRLAREVPTFANGGARWGGDGPGRRLHVTYRLRDGLTWQDGAPLTSADVRFAWEIQTHPQFPLIDRSLVGKVDEVQTLDALTAVAVFKPGAFDPDYARVGDVAPRHLWGTIPPAELPKSEFAANPVHAGPYRLKEFRPNEYAIYEANARYWAGPPRAGTIVLKMAADSNAMFAQARAGQQDVTMFGYTGADLLPELERFAADGRHTVTSRPSTSTLIVALNLDRPLLADVRVRRALLAATDRAGMNRAILHGRVDVLDSWMTPASAGYQSNVPALSGRESAARLLAEAGWAPGPDGVLAKDGQRFAMTLWGRTEDRQRELYMQAIARDWRAVGIEAEIKLQPTEQVFGKRGAGIISRRDFDAVIWQVSPMDAAGGYTLWHSSQIPSEANGMTGENYVGWRNAAADAALETARGTTSEVERVAVYGQHQRLFMEDLPALPLFSHGLLHLARAGVRNYRPTNSVRVADTWNVAEWEADA